MKRIVAAAVFLALAGCAGRNTGAPAPRAAGSVQPSSTTSAPLTSVRQVNVSSFAQNDVVCRVEKPTGSRIAIRRCGENADEVTDDLMREDFRTMRDQQLFQMRQAQEAARRQRGSR